MSGKTTPGYAVKVVEPIAVGTDIQVRLFTLALEQAH
jgi:hypothetical protein